MGLSVLGCFVFVQAAQQVDLVSFPVAFQTKKSAKSKNLVVLAYYLGMFRFSHKIFGISISGEI